MGLDRDRKRDKMSRIGPIVCAIILTALIGCTALRGAARKDVSPADREAKNKTWYFACCDPGLDAATKELCKMAANDEDHILWDEDHNRYIFVWDGCEVGKEPWRKWE